MAQCSECHAQIMVYEHRCPKCGTDVRGNEVRPTSERAKVRLCHLVALPGMIFAILPMSWLFALGPLSIIIPWVIRSHPATSPTVRQHLTEVLNFQLLWLSAVYLLMVLSAFAWIALYPFVWFAGIIMVLFMTYDAGNGGDGKYLVRIPVFK